jgi:ubiquinol-cytochrome c reductase cytochrome b subunit
VPSLRNALRALGHWFEDRTGIPSQVQEFMRHPVPPGTDWRYVLGSATLVAFLLQVLTGTALATIYVPSTSDAYQSLQLITHGAFFGRMLRGMHYFGASAMVILIGAHMARVFLTGSYKFPREWNWLSGAALLFLTLLMAFTGQLLRWDQDGVWSGVIAAEQAARVPLIGTWLAHFILGGPTVGGPTLSRSFATHVFFIPALIFVGVALHIYLVLRNGISEKPALGPTVDRATYRTWYRDLIARRGRPFWPDAAWRDVVAALALVALVIVLAVVVGPKPLGKPPDPTVIQASPRPDWYFLWYFAVLALIPPASEPWVIVLGPLLFGLVLILLPLVANGGRRRLRDRPWAVVIVLAGIAIIAVGSHLGNVAPWSPRFGAQPLEAQVVASTDPHVVRGAALFHDRGCEFCHMIAGQGGERGPDLTHVARRLDRAQIESRILGGSTIMPAYVMTLPHSEVDDLIAFLETRK